MTLFLYLFQATKKITSKMSREVLASPCHTIFFSSARQQQIKHDSREIPRIFSMQLIQYCVHFMRWLLNCYNFVNDIFNLQFSDHMCLLAQSYETIFSSHIKCIQKHSFYTFNTDRLI